MIRRAIAWIADARAWLTMLAVAGAAAWLYVQYETVRRDRDALLGSLNLICARVGQGVEATTIAAATTAGKSVQIRKARGILCAEAVSDLVTFRTAAERETARILADNLAERNRASSADAARAAADANAARSAAERMEKENANVPSDDRVSGSWFDALNDIGGLRRRDR